MSGSSAIFVRFDSSRTTADLFLLQACPACTLDKRVAAVTGHGLAHASGAAGSHRGTVTGTSTHLPVILKKSK